jgi:hypothetical protein
MLSLEATRTAIRGHGLGHAAGRPAPRRRSVFLLYSRGLPYRHFGHAVGIMLGRHDTPDEPGELSHAQALAAALSGTMGLGNIAGVALAIVAGGPGAVFWMWISALVGVATKFFTCTLGVMYRGQDSLGRIQGGPMYIIREALPKRLLPAGDPVFPRRADRHPADVPGQPAHRADRRHGVSGDMPVWAAR